MSQASSIHAVLLEKTIVYPDAKIDKDVAASKLTDLAQWVQGQMDIKQELHGHCVMTIDYDVKTQSVVKCQLLRDVSFDAVKRELKGSPETWDYIEQKLSVYLKYEVMAVVVGFTGSNNRRTVLC